MGVVKIGCEVEKMVYTSDFEGNSDNEVIENAILAKGADDIVVIEAKKDGSPWLLDRAILIPENTTVILRGCKIKLSDSCRDNFFRTNNCGIGIDEPVKIKNVHIKGEGMAVLEGADYPRATGDGGKILKNPAPYSEEDAIKVSDWIPEERRKSGKLEFMDVHAYTYGTDAGKEDESQYGDWRDIGILFANIDDFSIENIKMVCAHGWHISIEAGTNGKIKNIEFRADMSKTIDGFVNNIENQDGIDIRNGCSNIIISDITGMTGDDVVALTAIKHSRMRKGGSMRSSHVMGSDWSKRESGIHDIVIRNVHAETSLCWIVRLLAVETEIYNVVIDGIVDMCEDRYHFGTLLFGEGDGGYGKNLPDCIHDVTVSNVICAKNGHSISVAGYLANSTITNVITKCKDYKPINVNRENGLNNVVISNVVTAK